MQLLCSRRNAFLYPFFVRTKGKSKRKENDILLKQDELDRIVESKEKVQIRIVLPNVKTYKKYIDTFKEITKKANGTIAVKML